MKKLAAYTLLITFAIVASAMIAPMLVLFLIYHAAKVALAVAIDSFEWSYKVQQGEWR